MDIIQEINQNGLTKEQYEKCLQTIIDKKNGVEDIDWQEIVDMYELPISSVTLRKANGSIFGGYFVYEYLKRNNYLSNQQNISENVSPINNREVSINKDGSYSSKRLLEMNEHQCKDPEYLLKAHGFDSSCWKVVSVRNNIRQVVSRDDGVVTLYASFLTAKPTNELSFDYIKSFYNELITNDNRPTVSKKNNNCNGYMLEIPIQDVHFGKLSFSEDVAEPYNYNLAKERFAYVINDIIEQVKTMPIEKIIFPIGNDYLHIDNIQGNTTAGTRQVSDLSPQLMFKYGLECLIENINNLSEIAPVEVFCVNGNHDFLSSYHLICALECYYHNNENVIVNTDTSPRKYIEFGNVLVGFAHGDKERNRIDGIMQVEAREAWGRTKYHEMHMGHLHSEQTKETNGIIFRNLSSFTGTDNWHHQNGYVGAVKKCQSFLWDKKKGLRTIFISSID